MSNAMQGKRPKPSKPRSPGIETPSFFQNKLTVSPAIAKDIASRNMEYRWINYKKFVNDGGLHENGWTPYKPPKELSVESALLGANPDGIIRRGDCLLAVRSTEFCNEHRKWLKQKADLQSGFRQAKAQEFKEKGREAGLTAEERDYFEEDNAG